jgi:hypothetical protein
MVTIEQLNELIEEGNKLANAIHDLLLKSLGTGYENQLVELENTVRSLVSMLEAKKRDLMAQQQKQQQEVWECYFDKGLNIWMCGPKGQLKAPVTVAMAVQRVKYGFYPEIPLDVALWYKKNYPEQWKSMGGD